MPARPSHLIKQMDKLQSQSTSNTSSISQAAAVEALSGPQDSIDMMRDAYKRRRDMVVEMLNAAPGIRCHKPEGAFYVFPSMQGCIGKTSAGGKRIETDEDFCTALLEEEGVACVHGTAFMYPGYFRISYATSDAVLEEACTRIQRFCAGLKLTPAARQAPRRRQGLRLRRHDGEGAGDAGAGHQGHQPGESASRTSPRPVTRSRPPTRPRCAGDTKYPPQGGTPALKAAIPRKFKRDNNLDYGPDEIIVGNGGKQVIFNAFMATLDPGDEVVIPSPFWISYADMAKVAGGVPVTVSCPQNNGFKLRPEDLEAAITPKTKWVMLNFPGNPTGAVLSRAEMRAIAEVLLRHPHVWVMTDDMYEHLLYDGFEFCTIAEVEPRLKDRTLTVNGCSKTYAMTGWRVGFGGGPRALIQGMFNMQGQATSGVSTVGQAAAAAALDGPQDLVARARGRLQQRRDIVVEMLNAAPGITCHKPEGAFYVFPNIAGCLGKTSKGGRRIETDTDFALALLEEKHVAAVQGAAYGMSPYMRISYATDTASLIEACTRIQEFCKARTEHDPPGTRQDAEASSR